MSGVAVGACIAAPFLLGWIFDRLCAWRDRQAAAEYRRGVEVGRRFERLKRAEHEAWAREMEDWMKQR